ncbi:hypothetical protein I6F07_22170 [Ensifer sp. IC4062]|nr:hypothetical protein [Ensifer sp. IC4062]MCA1442880.1 hypothetical protein [Ensifer sp. IC4062]
MSTVSHYVDLVWPMEISQAQLAANEYDPRQHAADEAGPVLFSEIA